MAENDESLDSIYARTLRDGPAYRALDTILSRNGLDSNFQPLPEPDKTKGPSTVETLMGTRQRIAKIQAAQKAEQQPSFVRDVIGGTIGEVGRAAAGMVTDATREMLESADSLAGFFNRSLGLQPGGAFGDIAGAVPKIDENKTVGGKMARGIGQFAVGYYTGGKLLKGAAAATGAGKATAAMVKGAFSDATAFDPNDPAMSNWLNESFPGLKNPLTEFLATNPKDGEALNRFRRVVDGLVPGLVADAVIAGARNLRARMAIKKTEAAFTKAKGVPAGEPPRTFEGIDSARPTRPLPDETPASFEGIDATPTPKAAGVLTPEELASQRAILEGNVDELADPNQLRPAVTVNGKVEFMGQPGEPTHASVADQTAKAFELNQLHPGQEIDVGWVNGKGEFFTSEQVSAARQAGQPLGGGEAAATGTAKAGAAKPAAIAGEMDESVVERMIRSGEATEADVRVAQTASRIEESGVDPTISRDIAGSIEERIVNLTEEMRLVRGGAGDKAVSVGEIAESIEKEFLAREALARSNETINQSPEAMKYLKARLRRQDIENPVRGNPTLRAAYETALKGESEEGMTRQIIDKERRAMEDILKDEGGEISREAVYALARASVGGAIGLTQGETMEERIMMAAAGAGIGIMLKRSSAKKIVDIFRKVNPREADILKSFDPPDPADFRGATKTGLPRRPAKPHTFVEAATPAEMKAVLDADPSAINLGKKALKIDWQNIDTEGDLDDLFKVVAKENAGAIDEARRGVISRDMTSSLARMLGTTEDDILRANPGLATNAEQTQSWINIVGSALAETNRLKNLAKAGQPVEAQLRLMLGRSSALLQKLYGIRAEWGRAGGIWATMAEKVGKNAKTLSDDIQLLTIGNKTLDQIPIEKIVDMLDKLDGPGQQATFIRHATQMGRSMIMEAWINGMLSNPVTHAVNAVSNASVTALGIVERRIAEQFGNGVARGEAAAMLNGLLGGWDEAMTLAKKAWKENRSQFGASKLDYRQGAWADAADAAREVSGPLGKAVDILGAGITSPGRALMAADDFFKGLNYRMELNAQGWRQATSEGLSGEALKARYKTLISDPNFASLAKSRAEEFANYQTFNEALGGLGQGWLRFIDEHPWGRVVTPFVRTPVNIAKYSLERAPGLNLLMGKYRADLAAGGVRRDLALAKMTFGGMTMATGTYLGLAGYITGSGPKNKDLLAAKKLTGWQPYSLYVPGHGYVGYDRFDPLGVLLGLWGNIGEKAGELNDNDLPSLATAAVVGFTDVLMQKTYLRGLKDVFDTLTDVEQRDERYLQRLGGTLVPSGVAAFARMLDPQIKEINSMQDAIFARLPGYSEDVPARYNIKGDPIELEGGLGPDMVSPFKFSSEKDDAVAKEILRLDIPIKMPEKFIFGTRPRGTVFRQHTPDEGIKLFPEEYARLSELRGNALKINGKGMWDTLTEIIQSDSYKEKSVKEKIYAIQQTVSNFDAAAEEKLIEEFPELAEAKRTKESERREAQLLMK